MPTWLGTFGLVVILSATTSAKADSADGYEKALSLRPNVVRVIATLHKGGTPQFGFGFIVGKRADQAIIVTANHVVRADDDPDEIDPNPIIIFFEQQGTHAVGTLQTTSTRIDKGDIAVIFAPWPTDHALVEAAIAGTSPKPGDDVWGIGTEGTWRVPVIPGKIDVIDPVDRHIDVARLSVSGGSSGGPAVSSGGVIGMITQEKNGQAAAYVVPIDTIERFVREQWQYPWLLRRTTTQTIDVPHRFTHITGSFVREGDGWTEYPPHQYGNFKFRTLGIDGGYIYLVDTSRLLNNDPNRPVTIRIPIKGGMSQWGYPNPYQWQDLYVETPEP